MNMAQMTQRDPNLEHLHFVYLNKILLFTNFQEDLPRWIGQQAADRRHIQGGIAADSQSQNSFEFDLQEKGRKGGRQSN